ncbi:MAG: anaerobic ribonucleoside-triphosphate reductase activating protein [Desulfurococcus sp.]|nr:anaerobic ribonucleoside-triphosphate reductase activating protein [Desulfurococcus sp.]
MNILLIGSGWKSISLVDVYGSVTFTLWLCGCNLRCPFCHNWRLADRSREVCGPLDIGKLMGELEASKGFIDYLHVTGGEPLVQYKGLVELFKTAKSKGVPVSLNSNLTIYKPLKLLLEDSLVDHVATDLKAPFTELTGVPEGSASTLFRLYESSLKLIAEKNIALELRVPVARKLTVEVIRDVVKALHEVIDKLTDKTVVIVNPLLTKPLVDPRNPDWCSRFCMPEEDELREIAEVFRELGFKTVVKEVPR